MRTPVFAIALRFQPPLVRGLLTVALLSLALPLVRAQQATRTVTGRPTHIADASRGLRYAIALNDEPPQIVSLETAEYSKIWAANVLRSAAVGQTQHAVKQPGRQALHIWMVDPGVVIDKIIGATGGSQLPLSFLGPPETAYPALNLPATGLGWGPHYPTPGSLAFPPVETGSLGSR